MRPDDRRLLLHGRLPLTTVAGIFVGGAARRFGGIAKGLLPVPGDGRPITVVLAERAREVGCEPVLVGAHAGYSALGIPILADDPPGIGPLGGLRALLRHAERAGATHALAVATDMPFVTTELLARLLTEGPEAALLAPRREKWDLLLARWSVAALPALDEAVAGGRYALQPLATRLEAAELALGPAELRCLVDWDSPEDVVRGG